ncbi:hypothetical protein [Nocardioides sp.]|uniref:hypothetical protein n=1 Tax=Nocardioides sp. TaxID=35761 RepID=UPI003D0A2AF2
MIQEAEVAAWLRDATAAIDVPVVPAQELARAGQRRTRRRRLAVLAAGVGVAAVTTGVVLARLPGPDRADAPPSVGTPVTSTGTCQSRVPAKVLPDWATAGFSDPEPSIPYVLGDKGAIVAVLFAQPLSAPPSADHNNKILWVARSADFASDLEITARIADGSRTVTRTVAGGPGPSIIDLPEPGCWQLSLTWGDQSDSMALAYAAD